MQNPDEDTEWNDVLRAKGILPPKKELEVDEDTVVQVSYNYIELELYINEIIIKLWLCD